MIPVELLADLARSGHCKQNIYCAIVRSDYFNLHAKVSAVLRSQEQGPSYSAGVCHFPGLAASGAQLLADRNVNGVGVDSMGVDPGVLRGFPAHLLLLKVNIVLIENLANLGLVPPTGATGFILPMKIKDAPEAPVRAMALF